MERELTQNQQDALDFLKNGGIIACKGNRVWYVGESKFLLQKNTFDSLMERGLIHQNGIAGDVELYGLAETKE